METIILEYLKVFLSPQVVGAFVAFLFLLLFRNEIKSLFNRMATIKFPGGEISTSQAQMGKDIIDSSKTPKLPEVPDDGTKDLSKISLTQEQADKVKEIFNAERAKAYLWEYRFLNYYLVRRTQIILDWLNSLPQRTTISLFDSIWRPNIPDSNERGAIISALQEHFLIQVENELITVTPKGKEYISFRGPVPPLAT